MQFKFQPLRGSAIEVEAKTAKQGAQLAAFKLWQDQRDDLPKPHAHTEIRVSEPGPDANAPGNYGVTFVAPGETGAYTRATTLKLRF